mmetsp:Transcript_24392/g.34976  ORF Transcript_24392/g.34976 Transcript_24392/m.34976 type:complete len:100 (+) Transcript_24392:5993-6292(+)
MPLDVRLSKSTLNLQTWLQQVERHEKITAKIRQQAAMKEGSIIQYMVPRSELLCQHKENVEQQEALFYRAAAVIVRAVRHYKRSHSRVELPRTGIGDPG